MTIHFGRAWIVEIGDVKIESTDGTGMSNRVVFDVERDDTSVPNRASLRVYGLAPQTLNRLQAAPDNLPCRIQAGYKDNYQQIFAGELRRGLTVKDGTDVVFNAAAGEGTEKIQTSKINKTFPKGVDVRQVVETLAEQLGVGTIHDASDGSIVGSLSTALTVQGDTGYELTELLAAFLCSWHITGDTLVIQRQDKLLATPGILVETLIKSPEIVWVKNKLTKVKEQLIKVVTILEPGIYPGVGIEVSGFGGILVKSTKHRGDTHTNTWELEFEGKFV
jgi:hypothetical protein